MYTIHWKTTLTAVCLCLAGTAAHAQGPTISLPDGGIYKAGPDYASDVLQDPWDFDNVEDISPDPNEFGGWVVPPPDTVGTNGTGQSFLSGGLMRGVAAGDTRMSLLHRTFADTLKPGRTGATYPIDPTAYRKMAVKMRVTGAAPADNLTVYWWHRFIVEGPEWEQRGGSVWLSPQVPAGASQNIYVADLETAPLRGPIDAYSTGPIKALWIDPTSSPEQKNLEIDWVRLTAADNAPGSLMIPVNLTGCSGFQFLTIADEQGFSTTVADASGSDQTRTFNAGILPPGGYNVTATCGSGTSQQVAFQINAPPQVTVLSPDEKGDPATDWALMNGDPWDFEQSTDVDRITNVTFSEGPCAGGVCGLVPAAALFPGRPGLMFRGSSSGTTPSQRGDPALGILEGAIFPINSLKHRILNFSLRIERPYNLGLGSVARFFWGSGASSDGLSVTGTEDMLAFPGPQTYTIDLATLSAANGGIETGCPGCPITPWSQRSIRHFRIDPHEFGDAPTVFDIDDVTLTAPYTVALGETFNVRFAFADPDPSGGSTYTAHIYSQPWAGGSPIPLGSMPGIAPGTHNFPFQPLNAGEYRISVEVVEQRANMAPQTSRAFSTGMLVVTDPAASTPKLSVSFPQPNQSTGFPFNIQGCAYDDGQGAGGIGMDDIAISMRAIAGPRTGLVLPLGFHPTIPHTGVLQFGPLGTAVNCPTAPGSPYTSAGFQVAGVGDGIPADWLNGTWVLDVQARSTKSGETVVLPGIQFVVGPAPPQAPQNFQASAQGNTVFVSWGTAAGAASYQIEVAIDPQFQTVLYSLGVPAAGQYQGDLPSGTYYLRVFARASSGALSSPTQTVRVDVALPTPPGAPTLVATQVSANPVTLNWAPGPGGAPAAYDIHAGTAPGASDLLVAPMGLATGVTAAAPIGIPIFVRIVARNAAGAATSNEISFVLAPPGPPALQPAVVAGSTVTLSWTPPAGSVPTGYTVLARFPGQPQIIARLGASGAGTTVQNVPPGSYQVTVVSNSPLGTSAESNAITVTVSP